MVEIAKHLWRGIIRRWLILSLIGIAWLIGGPIIATSLPYGFFWLFLIWVWLVGHVIIIVWKAGKEPPSTLQWRR